MVSNSRLRIAAKGLSFMRGRDNFPCGNKKGRGGVEYPAASPKLSIEKEDFFTGIKLYLLY